MSAQGRFGPFLLCVLATGLLLSLIGVACTSMRLKCKANCLDSEERLRAALENCLATCQAETKLFIGGPSCTSLCATERSPNTDSERIRILYEECKRNCPPPDEIAQGLFLGGSAAVLVVLAIVLTRCCTCGGFLGIFGLDLARVMAKRPEWQAAHIPAQRYCGCVRLYALVFYLLSLFLFCLVVIKNMSDEVGLKIVCIAAAVVSLSWQGLNELWVMLQQLEIPYQEVNHLDGPEEQTVMPQTIGAKSR
eukprot:CAMPEP_0117476580 /NCGR_PEP_ID=MMETSP0784-20121206/10381_1 /TAXON_ID=39447 /ORGANISM="" /LENGTH=249 /DNA_ID=CAMNT_0005270857 /DNA_START=29 /DNA_END=778 /DNA_ORIENTATION=+